MLLLCFAAFLFPSENLFAHNPNSDLSNSTLLEKGIVQFIPNKGQWDERVLYKVPMNNGSIYLENKALTFQHFDSDDLNEVFGHAAKNGNKQPELKTHAYRMNFKNAQATLPEAQYPFEHYYNYFRGNDPGKWAANVSSYQQTVYKELYSGIDLELFQGESSYFKYQFRLEPGADHSAIAIEYEGLDSIWIKGKDLHYRSSLFEIRETNLLAYQEIAGERMEVSCRFYLQGNTLKFEIGSEYNPDYELVIDPDIIFSTYTGSFSDNFGFTATYDSAGSLYAGGIVFGANYPTTTGAFQENFSGVVDVGISKFTSDGSALIYSTYLGGVDTELPSSLVVNSNNELIVMGSTGSIDFPTSLDAFDRIFNGGSAVSFPNNGAVFSDGTDIFVTKFNADGSALLGSTYIGGTDNDGINDNATALMQYNYGDQFRGEVIVDDQGNIYVASSTNSSNFPVTGGVFQPVAQGGQDACVFQLSPDLDAMVWSSYLGGSQNDAAYAMALDDAGNLYVCGGTNSFNFPVGQNGLNTTFNGSVDGFIVRINQAGDNIISGTFFGTVAYDQSYFIDLDIDRNVYILGQTEGVMNSTPGIFNNPNSGLFLAGLNEELDSLRLQTTIGIGNNLPLISPTAFLVDDVCKSIYISGWGGDRLGSGSIAGLPLTTDAFQSTTDGDDFYLMVLSENARTLEYATYMGGNISEEHVDGGTSRFDKSGTVYQAVCGGCGGNSDFPTTPGVVSNINRSSNCNLAAFKFNINFLESEVNINTQDGCVPLDVQLELDNPNADYIYWNLGDSTIIEDTSIVNHTYTQAGVFQIMLVSIDSTTCSNTVFIDTVITQVVAIDDSVFAGFNFSTISNCDSMIVDFTNTSIDGNSFTWDFGDNTTSTSTSPVHVYRDSGIYEIKLIARNVDACNLIDTATAIVEFYPRVRVDVFASDTSECLPFDVQFYNRSGTGDTLQWFFSNGFSSTDDTVNYLFDQAGTYEVMLVVTDSNTCNITDTAYQEILVRNDTVIAAFDSLELINNCDSIYLQFNNQSILANAYQWYFGTGDSSTLTSPQYSYDSVGIYEVQLIAYNHTTCNQTDTATMPVELKPRINAEVGVSENIACVPLDVEFYNLSESSDSANLLWTFSNGATASDDTVLMTFNQAGIHSAQLVVQDPNSCNLTDTAYGGVFGTDDSVFAAYDTTHLADNCDSLVIQFNNLSSLADSGIWYFGNGDSSVLDNPVYRYDTSGIYEVQLIVFNDSTCNLTDTFKLNIEFKRRLVMEVSALDTLACVPLSVQLYNQNGPSANTDWFFSNGFTSSTDTLDYTFTNTGTVDILLVGTDSSTCNISDSATAQIRLIDDSVFAAFDTIMTAELCDSLVLDFNNNSINATDYQWIFSDSTFSDLFEPEKVFSDTGIFEIMLVASNPATCNLTDTAYARALGKLPVLAGFSAPGDCYPYQPEIENVSFNVEDYSWYLNGNSISSDSIPVFTLQQAGTYELLLVVDNPNSCNLSDSIIQPLHAYDYPTAYFETDTNVFPIFSRIRFQNRSTGALRYEWDFDDGNFSEQVSPEHIYEYEGNYRPCLTAINEHDCISEYCKEMEMTYRGLVDLPNAFSPNADGYNDVLYVKGFGVERLELKIYNRWGELVFESNSLERGWDGTYKGKAQEQEVYTFTLKAWFRNGTETPLRKGNITLLR
ncbi:MAG: PKD domain-containing protein [Chitinophagales bacterium]